MKEERRLSDEQTIKLAVELKEQFSNALKDYLKKFPEDMRTEVAMIAFSAMFALSTTNMVAAAGGSYEEYLEVIREVGESLNDISANNGGAVIRFST